MTDDKMTPQMVGAYGEKMVEAALLRRCWIPSNVNASVKNAARFDIVAQGPDAQLVPIRVKTCGIKQEAFQYGFKAHEPVPKDDVGKVDFTVLVAMGENATADRFFVVPTRIVRDALEAAREFFYRFPRKDGVAKVDTGQITLWLKPLKSGSDDHQHDFAQRWKHYLDAWDSLAGVSSADAALEAPSNVG
jgi:hypothetical protein